MSDKSQRTEQATPRRIQKAREQGQFPQAKEFVAALQFAVAVGLLTAIAGGWLVAARADMRAAFELAFSPELTPQSAAGMLRRFVVSGITPVAGAAGVLLAITLAAQLLSTNMGLSLSSLAPQFSRFNPMSRLKQIPRQNVMSAIQAPALLAIMAYVIYAILDEHLADFLRLPLMDIRSGIGFVSNSVEQLLWRMAGVLVVFGAAEFLRQRWLYYGDLAMTKQEIREEHKDQEGDPHIKARLRRMRQSLLRRRMMQEVPTATAVIVNPTHYAVAIRYDMQTMVSPRVVAKGRNYLAARIRQLAIESSVLIVENPPLARALYESVEVGREIPPDFYRAVAEVLAYVYKMLGRRV